MPTYTFRHKETGEVVDKFLQISKRDKFIEDNPQPEQTCAYTSIPIGDPVRLGIKTTDNGFKEVLAKTAYEVHLDKNYPDLKTE